tara:strand:+ start:296 stop:586 length:291 start_codon:yes stop_codon:yes gene_type:complete
LIIIKNSILQFLRDIYISKIYKFKGKIMNTNNGIWRLTSIKLLTDVYRQFRSKNKIDNMTLQKLVNRSMWLFLNDDTFKEKISQTTNLRENYKKGY